MKIQRLFLRNVRSIKSLDLDFRDPMTGKPMSRIVLAGANGSGKTTILESIFGLLTGAERYGQRETNRYSELRDVEINLSVFAQMQIFFEIQIHGGVWNTLSVSYGEKTQILSDGFSEIALVGGPPPPLGNFPLSFEQPRLPGSLFVQLANSIEIAKKTEPSTEGSLLYFPSNRYLPNISQGQLSVEPQIYHWAYRYSSSKEWKGSIENYLFSLNYLDLEDRDRNIHADRFGRAVTLVNSVLDKKRIARIERGRVIVETDQGETHGLGELSSGERHLVLLLIEIIRRVVKGSVILIDEPEISLHPAWQRGLVVALDKIIEQYDAQVIMATHSSEIASMVMPHEVLFLSDLDLPLGEWKPEQEALA